MLWETRRMLLLSRRLHGFGEARWVTSGKFSFVAGNRRDIRQRRHVWAGCFYICEGCLSLRIRRKLIGRVLVQCDQLKNAIDCCIQLNHWQTAIDLAKNRDMTDINEMLTRYAKQLLDNKCYVQAVELYRRAGCFLEAAKIVQKVPFLTWILIFSRSEISE